MPPCRETTMRGFDDAMCVHDDEGAVEEVDYGYDDASESAPAEAAASTTNKFPRRSSLKSSDPSTRQRRRASISYKGEIQVVLPDKTVVKRRTSVSFPSGDDGDEDGNNNEQLAEVKLVTPASELTDKPERLWFQAEEYKNIKRRAKVLIELMREDPDRFTPEHLEELNLCTRGFDNYVSHEQHKAHRERSRIGGLAVLAEQRRQRLKGRGQYDDESIGFASQYHTAASQQRALYLAQRDYAEVRGEHEAFQRAMTRFRCNRRCSM